MPDQLTILRDANGRRIAEIENKRDGMQIIRNMDGRRLGQYTPTDNITRDANGRRVGEGNLLVALIQRG